MSASITSICNDALTEIGAARISSIDDDSNEARVCKQQFEVIRDAVLESHPWNCAIKRVQLAQSTTVPVFGHTYQYELPEDCFRVIEVNTRTLWTREGNFILSDDSSFMIRYIAKTEDVSKYSATLRRAMALELAANISYSLVQSVTLKESLTKKAFDQMRLARSFDAQEGSPQKIRTPQLIDARR